MISSSSPMIENLAQKERDFYLFGLKLLSICACEDFFDISKLPDDRFSKDGLFYTIPYYHDETLWSSGNSRTILVMYKVENKSSYCPMRLEIELIDNDNYILWLHDQTGQRTIKKRFIQKEKGQFFTDISNYDMVLLSQLVDIE